MKVYALRGAVQLEADRSEEMDKAVARLITEIMAKNRLAARNLVHVTFSHTSDLASANPATSLRRHGLHSAPLFCVQEPAYPESLPRTLRILILCRASFWSRAFWTRPKHCYLGGARALRPDLAEVPPSEKSANR